MTTNDDVRWFENRDIASIAGASRDELAAVLEAMLDRVERRHPLIDADRLVFTGALLRKYAPPDIDSIIVDWMRRQPSNARVDIASWVLQSRWYAPTSIAPASVEAVLEALRGPLAPEAEDGCLFALANALNNALPSGLYGPLRARVVIELCDALGRPHRNPVVPHVVQRALEWKSSRARGESRPLMTTDDIRWLEDWDSERLARTSREELAVTLEATLDRAEHHPLIYAGQLIDIGEKLRKYAPPDIESIIVDWMRRQPSSARVDIASQVLQGRWNMFTSIVPASIEALLEMRSGPLTPKAQDASIHALINALTSDLDGSLRARVVVELRDALGRPQKNPNIPDVVQRALKRESSRAGGDDIRWLELRDLVRLSHASRNKLAGDPRDKLAGDARDKLRRAAWRDEVVVELQAMLDGIERHHPVIDADRVRSTGYPLRDFGPRGLDSIVADWMRRQPSSARVHIASLLLQSLWDMPNIAPASVEALLEARRGPLTPEAEDESILALAQLTETARCGFSGLAGPLLSRVEIELRDALGRPHQNPVISEVLQRTLERDPWIL